MHYHSDRHSSVQRLVEIFCVVNVCEMLDWHHEHPYSNPSVVKYKTDPILNYTGNVKYNTDPVLNCTGYVKYNVKYNTDPILNPARNDKSGINLSGVAVQFATQFWANATQ